MHLDIFFLCCHYGIFFRVKETQRFPPFLQLIHGNAGTSYAGIKSSAK